MNFNEFSLWFRPLIVFNTKDILKVFPKFNLNNLSNWNKAGYITKLTKGVYIFDDIIVDKPLLFYASNKIVPHSYISSESAIEYHGIGLLENTLTSVSSNTSYSYMSPLGHFKYHKIYNAGLMTDIKLIKSQSYYFKIASVEKAIADYFFFNSRKQTRAEIQKLDFYRENIRLIVDADKLLNISKSYDNDVFSERIRNFLKVFHS